MLERLMKKVIVSSNKLVQKSHAYAQEMGEFNMSFQALVHTEQATAVLAHLGELHLVLQVERGGEGEVQCPQLRAH